MPHEFESSQTWRATLAARDEDSAMSARERLRNAFYRFRDRVAVLAAEIHRDLPDYTVHDITHLDALWGMADIIVGERFDLTPSEGFVLGGSFLLHDLGMGLAAYPDGMVELQKERTWADIVTAQFQARLERVPTSAEILDPPEGIRDEAIALMLRNLHAKHAERLAQIAWKSEAEDSPQFLIDDNEIRQIYGRVIGLIAHSHWWPISRLENEFSRTLGPPHWCPTDWIVDPLKISCLLRVCDASHVDARRAPSFLRAIRKPTSYSDVHWKFQERLQKPYRADDALAYTSGYAFPLKDAQSWWLCLDTLTMIDRELRQVDALLADKGLQRLAARRVAGIEAPERLVAFIPVDGWLPVNAVLQVSDVPRLVKSLGGEQLYGADPTIPLRELIQNSADAIRARRIIENRADDWGEILIRLSADENGNWLEVNDNGLGMSSEVLTHHLLDFGVTYWGSQLMMEEFPGLLSAGLKTTGKYGIGFFSVFMLGEGIRIRTRRSDAAQHETLVFEFNTGVSGRPILRPALPEERIRDGGTSVRIWLEKPPENSGLLGNQDKPLTLEQVCRGICPTLDVTVKVEQGGVTRTVLRAKDWTSIDGADLLSRLRDQHGPTDSNNPQYQDLILKAADNLRILLDSNGAPIGRACITREFVAGSTVPGVVTVGGLSACNLRGITGVLFGESIRAIRDIAVPLVSKESLAAWASDQARLVSRLYNEDKDKATCATTIRLCGGSTGDLPIAQMQNGWVNFQDIATMKNPPDEFLLVNNYQVSGLREVRGFRLEPNVILTDDMGHNLLQALSYHFYLSTPYHRWPRHLEELSERTWYMSGMKGLITEAAAEAWLTTTDEVLNALELGKYEDRIVAWVENDKVVKRVFTIRNPRKISGANGIAE